MARYVALGTTRALAEELTRDGYLTKYLHGRGGIPFSRGALCHLLGNPIYRGKVTHKGTVYDGQHEAIVDEALWDQVQALLAERRNNASGKRSPRPSLLAGLIHDGEGRRMTPSHTSKGGKRYRYYVTHPGALIAAGAIAWRISAPEAERIVIDRLKSWLGDRGAILTMAGAKAAASAFIKAQQATTDLDQPGRRLPLIEQLVGGVDIGQDCITLTLNRTGVQKLLEINQLPGDDPIHLTAHTIRIRQGKDVRMIVRDEQDRSTGTINQPLVALIAEAQAVHQALLAAPDHSIASLAASLGKCRKRAAQLLRVALLAPDIVTRCIAGTQPVSLTTRALLNTDLPISWQQQRAMLRFA